MQFKERRKEQSQQLILKFPEVQLSMIDSKIRDNPKLENNFIV